MFQPICVEKRYWTCSVIACTWVVDRVQDRDGWIHVWAKIFFLHVFLGQETTGSINAHEDLYMYAAMHHDKIIRKIYYSTWHTGYHVLV